ncbi:hypothetical protein CHS0354_002096 [Potamilus streckersoni]|uniref:Uncharacterized protein n=1 Tax=Potamilus streckersoni TaxID=2493646 RepID=A0AAE0W6U5_9BIVA|nr:hypothetical protein CHS0354_002096 [Potamilus streckersoni]
MAAPNHFKTTFQPPLTDAIPNNFPFPLTGPSNVEVAVDNKNELSTLGIQINPPVFPKRGLKSPKRPSPFEPSGTAKNSHQTRVRIRRDPCNSRLKCSSCCSVLPPPISPPIDAR